MNKSADRACQDVLDAIRTARGGIAELRLISNTRLTPGQVGTALQLLTKAKAIRFDGKKYRPVT